MMMKSLIPPHDLGNSSFRMADRMGRRGVERGRRRASHVSGTRRVGWAKEVGEGTTDCSGLGGQNGVETGTQLVLPPFRRSALYEY